MNASEIAVDGTVLVQTLTTPARGLGAAVGRRRIAFALAVATAASLATAAVVVPRVDYAAAATAKLDRVPPPGGGGGEEGGEELTPYQREEAIATTRKLGEIAGWTLAALAPSLISLGAALFLFLGFRVAGTSPGFRTTLAVTAHGMLPVWLGGLLAIPAAFAHAPIPPADVGRLLPSSLAAFAPHGAAAPLLAALSAFDLFALWAAALVAFGMARASGAARARAITVTAILFLAYVALLKVVPAALAGGSGPR